MVAKAGPAAGGSLILGIIYPATVLAIELVTRFCASAFFDPMPTVWHAGVVALVPLSNLTMWLWLRDTERTNTRWLSFISGISISVAGFYALIFLPLTPLALWAIEIYGPTMMIYALWLLELWLLPYAWVGLLPFAPLVSLISAFVLRARLAQRSSAKPSRPMLWTGIAAGALVLVMMDVQSAVNGHGSATSNSISNSIQMWAADPPGKGGKGKGGAGG